MDIDTIGFTHKSASEFFETLMSNRFERLLDVRLSNTSQLAGFTKHADLEYFLKQICNAAYEHEPQLAPSEELFRAYRKEGGSWEALASGYLKVIKARKIESTLSKSSFKKRTVLLSSEAAPEHCHRRLALEYSRSAGRRSRSTIFKRGAQRLPQTHESRSFERPRTLTRDTGLLVEDHTHGDIPGHRTAVVH